MSSSDKEKEKATSSAQKSGDLGLLEEDDEFEEFPAEGKITWIYRKVWVGNLVK
jgi:hypothetical protein